MSKIRRKGSPRNNNHRMPKIKISRRIKFLAFGAIAIFLSLFFLLSFFDKAGIAGRGLVALALFLIGKISFILPLIFFLIGALFFSKRIEAKKSIAISAFFLVLALSSGAAVIEFRKNLNTPIRVSEFGGWVGSILSWPFLRVFGFWMAMILFLAMVIICAFFLGQFLYRPAAKKIELKKADASQSKKINIKKIFFTKFKVKEIEGLAPTVASAQKNDEIRPDTILGVKKIGALKLEKGVKLPPVDLLEEDKGEAAAGDIQSNSQIIKRTLENFGIPVEMAGVNVGPTVTQYTLKPAEGIKLSKITALNNNLALALSAHPIRIEAPIPGKPLVGIEIPNQKRVTVRLKNLLSDSEFQNANSWLSFGLGRDVVGAPIFTDLTKMPHLLVAGSTGTGKTICLNTILLGLLYKNTPKTLRMILIDPKRVEFSIYNSLSHLLSPVIYDASKTVNALKWLINEMERRFEILSEVGARNIYFYNQKIEKNGKFKKEGFEYMPYIVLVVDELADLMASRGKDVEAGIVRLSQKARAVGIHLILATQRPSVEVITGLIKANIIARIAFQVASQIDSRTILDTSGAEKLLGSGDMLFQSSIISKPKRIQGAYVSEKEVSKVVDFINKNQHSGGIDGLSQELEQELEKEEIEESGEVFSGEEDPLYEEAKRLIIETKKASASFLQRRLRVGYARAARLLDMLEGKGIIGAAHGAKPREVYGEREKSLDERTIPDPKEKEYENDYNEGIK